MVCQAISSIGSITDLIVYPTTCAYYFYLIILLVVMIVISWTIYKIEETRLAKPDLISSLAVGSIATVVLALIGTLIKNSSEIPMIQTDIFLIFLSICVVLILAWVFKKE